VEYRIAGAFITAILIVLATTPSLRKIARAKKIFDKPDPRKSHQGEIPLLGGVTIFLSAILSFTLWLNFSIFPELPFLFVCIILLFLVGLKDDILITAPFTKLFSFIVISLIIILLGDVRITNFHGLFSLIHVPYSLSFISTLILILLLINGFNLIDGIDGLAGSTGILSGCFFFIWFYMNQEYELCIVAIILVGALIGYLRYNLAGIKKKVFMGDSGSLLTGFILVFLGIKFNETIPVSGSFHLHSGPAIAFGVFIIPVMDLLNVFITRIIKGKSPFQPDKEHIHHHLIRLGFSHRKATIYLLSLNLIIIVMAVLLDFVGILWLVLIQVVFYLILTSIPRLIYKKQT